jgi:VCBS repeat-containing protein
LTVANSTVSGNSNDGINNYSGNAVATIRHSTIVSHTQAGVVNSGSAHVLNLEHTIVANNGFWDSSNTAGGTFNDCGYNLVEDGTCITAGTSFSGDPDIAPLADNGGDTLTHELNPGSPALDMGDPTYPSTLGDYDQRGAGFPRVSGGRIDMGALEHATVACFVETNGDNVTDDSSVDATALRAAVDAASSGALIKVAGTCAGVNVTNGISQTVYIDESLTLQGGHNSTNWLTPSDPTAYPTILDAQGMGRVAVVTGTVDVTLDGLIFTGGESAGGGLDENGGGIYSEANLTMHHSLVIDNHASGNGGGIYQQNGTLTVYDVTVQQNTAGLAAVFGDAGGIYALSADLTLEDSLITGNSAADSAGGIYADSSAIIRRSTISGNSALNEGGGLVVTGATLMIEDSTFAHNSAANGGGLFNDISDMTLLNTTVSTNTATTGGGILNNGSLTLTHVTLANNSNVGLGQTAFGDVWMQNSIIAYNGGMECETGNFFTDLGYNLVEDGSCISVGTSTSGDPMLGSLTDNGGSTETHAPTILSPVIDAIPNGVNGCDTTVTADQRGFPRPFGVECDMGAVEYPPCLDFPMIASNELELNAAIYCFNEITEAGTYTINLTANIALVTSTIPVDNSVPGISLVMDGGMGSADINGFGASGIRPLEIKNVESVHLIRVNPIGGNVTGNGGGILIDSVPVTLTNSILYTNTATGNGGGLWTNAPLVLQGNSIVFDNEANTGGGLFLSSGSAVLTVDSTYFAENRATNNGGAINHGGSNSGNIISSSLFENNMANNGGALQTGENIAIASSSFLSNTAVNEGGALKFTDGNIPIDHSLFVGNTADDGGAIFIDQNAKLEMSNSTVSGNTAAAGGGMYFNETYESSFVRFTTLYGNAATTGGGMYVSGGTAPLAVGESVLGGGDGVYLRASIIAGSIGGDCANPDGEFNDNQYNLIEDGSCINEPTSLSGDPMLGPLADNGGPVILGQPTLTHALLPSSPALDYIPNGAIGCGTAYVTDHRGFTRPFDNLCDLGAVELNVNYPPVAVNDLYTTTEEITLTVPISLGVLLNDVDGDWDGLTAVLSTTTSSGNLSLNSDGSFNYLPDEEFCGTDNFTYIATDGEDDSAVATVAITVTCVNDAPVAVDDSYVGVEDTVLSVPAMGVLANDVDVDGDVLTATLLTDVVTGTLALSSDGALVYTPTLNWFGVVTFTYQANDGLASSETAVVTLTILSENDPPLVNAGSDQSVNEGDVVQFNGTFVDPGQQFAEGGTGIQWDFGDGYTASGTLTPTHSYGDNGVYTVTLTITDTGGAAMSDNLLVTAANIAPELSALPDQSVLVGTVVSFTAVFTDPGILDTHTAVINWGDGSSEAGTVDPSAMTVSGSHLYASEGVYTVTVTLTDDDGGTATQTFTVTATDTVPTGYTLYLPFVTK